MPEFLTFPGYKLQVQKATFSYDYRSPLANIALPTSEPATDTFAYAPKPLVSSGAVYDLAMDAVVAILVQANLTTAQNVSWRILINNATYITETSISGITSGYYSAARFLTGLRPGDTISVRVWGSATGITLTRWTIFGLPRPVLASGVVQLAAVRVVPIQLPGALATNLNMPDTVGLGHEDVVEQTVSGSGSLVLKPAVTPTVTYMSSSQLATGSSSAGGGVLTMLYATKAIWGI